MKKKADNSAFQGYIFRAIVWLLTAMLLPQRVDGARHRGGND